MVCQSIISQCNRDNFAKGESWLCVAVCNFLKNNFKAKYHDFFKAGRATFRLPVAKQCQVNMQYISYWVKSFLKEHSLYINFFMLHLYSAVGTGGAVGRRSLTEELTTSYLGGGEAGGRICPPC